MKEKEEEKRSEKRGEEGEEGEERWRCYLSKIGKLFSLHVPIRDFSFEEDRSLSLLFLFFSRSSFGLRFDEEEEEEEEDSSIGSGRLSEVMEDEGFEEEEEGTVHVEDVEDVVDDDADDDDDDDDDEGVSFRSSGTAGTASKSPNGGSKVVGGEGESEEESMMSASRFGAEVVFVREELAGFNEGMKESS
jgi:hypothetical protein